MRGIYHLKSSCSKYGNTAVKERSSRKPPRRQHCGSNVDYWCMMLLCDILDWSTSLLGTLSWSPSSMLEWRNGSGVRARRPYYTSSRLNCSHTGLKIIILGQYQFNTAMVAPLYQITNAALPNYKWREKWSSALRININFSKMINESRLYTMSDKNKKTFDKMYWYLAHCRAFFKIYLNKNIN